MILIFVFVFNTFAEKLEIHLSKRDLRHFEQVTALSLKQGYLFREANTLRSAKLKIGEKELPIGISLRGDLPRHWKGTNKSVLIEIPSGQWQRLTKMEASLAVDKYYFLPIWVHQTFTNWGHVHPSAHLVQLQFFPLGNEGLYLIEESVNEEFRERNQLPAGDFYRPNNQWVFSINRLRHPFAINYLNPVENHPFTQSCTFYKPTLRETLHPTFCETLEQLRLNPLEPNPINLEHLTSWMAISAFLGDTHSGIHDNYSWYMNFYNSELTAIPRDFIPLNPIFLSLQAFEAQLRKLNVVFKHVLDSQVLHKQYRTKLGELLLQRRVHYAFFDRYYGVLNVTKEDTSRMAEMTEGLKKWHMLLLADMAP